MNTFCCCVVYFLLSVWCHIFCYKTMWECVDAQWLTLWILMTGSSRSESNRSGGGDQSPSRFGVVADLNRRCGGCGLIWLLSKRVLVNSSTIGTISHIDIVIGSMPEQSNDYRVVVFGAGGVGKSSLVLRFVKGTFRESYIPTVEDTYRQVSQINSTHTHTHTPLLLLALILGWIWRRMDQIPLRSHPTNKRMYRRSSIGRSGKRERLGIAITIGC